MNHDNNRFSESSDSDNEDTEVIVDTDTDFYPYTPLLPPKSFKEKIIELFSDQETVISHIPAFVYNIETVLLYFFSANNFLKHLAEAEHLPDWITNTPSLDHKITDFAVLERDIPLFAIICILSTVLFFANQRSAPARFKSLVGWQDGEKKGERGNWFLAESVLAALWKTTITSTSLLAFLASTIPYLGFTGAAIITGLAFPGSLLAQSTNFLEPYFRKLFSCDMPNYIKMPLTIYLNLGATASYSALYFNSSNLALYRIGWMSTSIVGINNLPAKIAVNIIHGAANFAFDYKTFVHYHRRIYDFLSNKKTDATNATVLAMPNYGFFDRVDTTDIVAALYKVVTSYLATIAVIDLGYPLDDINPLNISLLIVLGLVQSLNLPVQMTFFCLPNKILWENNVQPGSGYLACFANNTHSLFKSCINRARKQQEDKQPTKPDEDTPLLLN